MRTLESVRRVALVLCLALLGAGCGAETSLATNPDADAGSVPVRVQGAVEATDDGHGFRVCPGGQHPCWPIVDDGGHEIEQGNFVLEGTWSEETFALTAAPAPQKHESDFPNPCPDLTSTPGTMEDGVDPISRYIASMPESFAGVWHAGEVVVIAVTDDADRHRDEPALDGVCLTDDGFRFTDRQLMRELEEIASRSSGWKARGWHLNTAFVDAVANRIVIEFEVTDPMLLTELSGEFGDMLIVKGLIEVLEGRAGDVEPSPKPGDIRIATRRRGGARMQARAEGMVLHYDEVNDCIYVGPPETRVMVVWPSGTRALRDPVRVVDGDGNVIAKLGEPFDAGGGHVEGVEDDLLACGATNSFVM